MPIITVTNLVLNFAEACRSLRPYLDRAEVPWKDKDQYDNWDRIAQALFESLVIEPCAFQLVGEAGLSTLQIPRYGSAATNRNAWVALEDAHSSQLLGLSSVAEPFDHAQCLHPSILVPLENASFVFVHEAAAGARRAVERVDLKAE